jgi:LPS export ABC transporter protein LptC
MILILQKNTYFMPLVATIGLFLLVACERTVRREDVFFTQDDAAVEVGKNVEILYSDSAMVRVRITSPLLHNFTDKTNPRQEFPTGVKVDFLNQATIVQSTLTAKTATRYPEKGQVIARDSVVMVTAKKEKLETEELTWDEKTAKIRTDKFVKVSKPDEVIYGFGLEAEQDFSYWRILVPKGKVKVDSPPE